MKKKTLIIIISIILTLLVGISISFAFFTKDGINIATQLNYNLTYGPNDYNFNAKIDNTNNVTKEIDLTISSQEMQKRGDDIAVGFDSTEINISIKNTTDSIVYCTYDYVWNWADESDNYTKSVGADKEFTVQGPFREVNVPNAGVSNFILGSNSIKANANETATKNEKVVTKFYNLSDINQAGHAGKNYKGIISIENVVCSQTQSTGAPEYVNFVDFLKSKVGTSGKNSGLDYSFTDLRGIRYAGKYPANFVTFNDESWRIIGIFDMEYDTDGDNIPDTTEPLVKMIRTFNLGSATMRWDAKGTGVSAGITNGTNYGYADWTESQLMMMLNPIEMLNQGYSADGSRIKNMKVCDDDSSYICDLNNYKVFKNMGAYWNSDLGDVYIPSPALTTGYTPTLMTASSSKWYNYKKLSKEAQDMIATVKWSTTSSLNYTNNTPYHFYMRENNIDSSGSTYGNRAYYWYGRVGLMYVSDYGYSAYGNPSVENYTRIDCINLPLRNHANNEVDWGKGDGTTYCANTAWMRYAGADSLTVGATGNRWTISQNVTGSATSNSSFTIYGSYVSAYWPSSSMSVQPVVYLKPGVKYLTGSGTASNPYIISYDNKDFSEYVNTDIETIPEGFYEIPKNNLYRFLGDYEESDSNYSGKVDNYICLGSNAATCPADNMYRMIGVVAQDDLNVTGLKAGMIKVIKNTPIGQYTWDGGTSLSDTNRNVNDSNYQTWIDADTQAPTWEESYLNTNILNETFLNSLSFKNRIASVKWHCYTNTSSTYHSSNENSASLCTTARKISLMYAADYMDSWGKYDHGVYTYANANNISWLHLCNDNTNIGTTEYQIYPCDQTTMSNYGYILDNNISYWRTYIIGNSPTQNGLRALSNYYSTTPKSTAQSVRPVFFLNNDVKITSGAGTYSNPFRVVF